MTSTTPRTLRATAARYLVPVLSLLLARAPLGAQEEAWRTHFAAGQEALASADTAGYAREMAAAAEAMEPGALNRPFAQYHAARAHALLGREAEALGWLDRMWREDIEALMASFAEWDPAFDALRASAAFRSFMDRPGAMTLQVRPLGGSVRLISGTGANVLASVGPDGVLLVDAGYGPAVPALRRALEETGAPARPAGDGAAVALLVLTHPHQDHWGGAGALGAEATVLAHPGTAAAMDEPLVFMEGVEVPPQPAPAHPDRVVRDTAFAFNGEEVRILPVEAHTGADLAVWFPRARVLALGDAWLAQNPMMFPGAEEPDAFLDRLEELVRALPADTRVVGGHDPVTDPAAVLAQIEATRATMAFVREALAEGLDAEAAAARGADRFPAPWVAYFHRALGAAEEGGGR